MECKNTKFCDPIRTRGKNVRFFEVINSSAVQPGYTDVMVQRDQFNPARFFVDILQYYNMHKSPQSHVLDNGCSTTGEQTYYMANKIAGSLVGLNVVTNAFSNTGFPFETVKFSKNSQIYALTDGNGLPFKKNMFSGVFSQNIMEHVLTPEEYISESIRVLKKDGILYMYWAPLWSGPSGHHLQTAIGKTWDEKYNDNWEFIPKWGHLYMSEEELKEYWKNKGLNDEFIKKGSDWIFHSNVLNRLKWSQIHQILKNRTDSQIVFYKCSGHHDGEELEFALKKTGYSKKDLSYQHCIYVLKKSTTNIKHEEKRDICVMTNFVFWQPIEIIQSQCIS